MLKQITFLFLLLIMFFGSINPAVAIEPTIINPAISTEFQITAKEVDLRVEVLNAYLAKFNSPLQYHAKDFVEAADLYQLDWKLVPSIAGVESTFGKRVPGGTDARYTSYNAWGWGVYGTQAIYFRSWRDGIFTVSKGLREDYFSRGLYTPYQLNKRYAASPTWGAKVSYFMQDMAKFEYEYLKSNPRFSNPDLTLQTSGSSALIAYR